MKKVVFGLMLIFLCTLQSCRDDEGTENVLPLIFTVEVVDMDGNDLLDPSFKGNIVNTTPTMKNIWGEEVRSTIYTDESFLYNQGKGLLIIDQKKVITNGDGAVIFDNFHYIEPGGPYFRSYSSEGWFNNETIIIKWGEGIENDTIVFSGGWKENWYGPGISKISINGKELERVKPQWSDNHFLYRKDMSSKN